MKQTLPMTPEQRQLVEDYLFLVPKMVTALTSTCSYLSASEREELIQIGSLALCRAAMTYDRVRPFPPYAKVVIRHALFDNFRATGQHREHFCSLDAMLTDHEGNSCEPAFPGCESTYALPDVDSLSHFIKDYFQMLEKSSCPSLQKGIESLRLQQQGYTSLDLAKHYGVSPNQVRCWQSKARKKLQQNQELYALLA